MTSTMTRQTTNTFQGDTNKLSILISSRIRLNEEERASLKAAYQKIKAGYAPKTGPSVNGSSLQVETAYSAGELDSRLGMNSITFADIVSSRESISMPMLIQLQQALGVTVVTRERMEEAFVSYLNHVLPE